MTTYVTTKIPAMNFKFFFKHAMNVDLNAHKMVKTFNSAYSKA